MSFLAFFWICDIGFQKSINTTVDAASRANLETVERLLEQTAPKGREAIAEQLRGLDKLWANGALFEVADEKGEWIFRSNGFLHPRTPVPNVSGNDVAFVTTNLDFNQYRIAFAAVRVNGQTFNIHAAVPTEPFDQALDRFRLIEQEGLPALVLIASLLGYWLSGKSLAPVDKIIRTAEMIGVDNLSRRLEVPKPYDELRRLTETLNAMLGRIESSFHKITQFTADASHDLRTPVAVMRATAEIALRKPRTQPEYEAALSRVLQTSVETSAMLENLLMIARADAGAAGLEMHPVDLKNHIRRAQEHGEILAATKSLSFSSQLPDSEVLVKGDAIAIDRLLMILIDNAVKYTPPGGRCEIALTMSETEAHIEVKDSGVGIESEDLESIFERFYRADKTRSREISGAGLGLAIARWIANVHGGSTSAESVIGTGSVFRVKLPALAAA